MDVLQSMFPDVSETILREVFQSTNGDLSRAADWILSGRHLEERSANDEGPNSPFEGDSGDQPAALPKPILIVRLFFSNQKVKLSRS